MSFESNPCRIVSLLESKGKLLITDQAAIQTGFKLRTALYLCGL